MLPTNLRSYTVIFSKGAEKFLNTLDKKSKQKILEKIKELQTDSENLDLKKLKSKYALYRLRVGSFRVVYSIQHDRVIVYVVAIGFRKNIYQHSSITFILVLLLCFF
jgi:mRNA interferase RelE/StbE